MSRKPAIAVIMGILVAGGLGAGLLWDRESPDPQHRTITITARQYAYDPPVVRVNRGDLITLKLVSADVTHGFFLEGYDIDAWVERTKPFFEVRDASGESEDEFSTVEEIQFVADRPGKFRYRCSLSCGSMHPFMQGELVVEPNRAFPASVGLTIGLVLATLLYLAANDPNTSEKEDDGKGASGAQSPSNAAAPSKSSGDQESTR